MENAKHKLLTKSLNFGSFQVDQSVTIVEETSSEAMADAKCDDSADILNLTAQIESFVKTAATDTEEEVQDVQPVPTTSENISQQQTEKTKQMRQSPESNDFYAGDECVSSQNDKLTVDKIQNLGAVCDYELLNNYERSKRSPVKILIREPTEEDNEVVEVEAASNTEPTVGVEDTKVHNAEEIIVSDTLANGSQEGVQIELLADQFRNDECNTPTSLEVENILENQNRYSITSTSNSLRITESCDDLPNQVNDESTSTFDVVNIPLQTSPEELPKNENIPEAKKELSTTSSRFEVRTIPLKNFSPAPNRKNSNSEIVTNGTATKEAPPTPPRRTRTVKEIIESINKSQSLLKINQDNKTKDKITMANLNAQTPFIAQRDCKSVDRNLNDATDKHYYRQKKLFTEVTDGNGNGSMVIDDDGFNNNEIPLCVSRYNEVSKNNSILFKKCVIGRNRNVHSANDGDRKSTNVEWNPVPKPRRHKHSP